MKMRSKKEIVEYMDEAFDRVWLNRRYNHFYNIEQGVEPPLSEDMMKAIAKAFKEVTEKYDIQDDEGDLDDWNYGFWSGVLATLRWVLGEESKDMLDT